MQGAANCYISLDTQRVRDRGAVHGDPSCHGKQKTCENLIRRLVLDTKEDEATPEHFSPQTLVAFSLILYVMLYAGPKIIADFNSVNSSLGVYNTEIISVSQRVT